MAMTKEERAKFNELKRKYNELKKEYDKVVASNIQLKEASESAFEKARLRDAQLDETLTRVANDMKYIQQQTASFAESILRVTRGE